MLYRTCFDRGFFFLSLLDEVINELIEYHIAFSNKVKRENGKIQIHPKREKKRRYCSLHKICCCCFLFCYSHPRLFFFAATLSHAHTIHIYINNRIYIQTHFDHTSAALATATVARWEKLISRSTQISNLHVYEYFDLADAFFFFTSLIFIASHFLFVSDFDHDQCIFCVRYLKLRLFTETFLMKLTNAEFFESVILTKLIIRICGWLTHCKNISSKYIFESIIWRFFTQSIWFPNRIAEYSWSWMTR